VLAVQGGEKRGFPGGRHLRRRIFDRRRKKNEALSGEGNRWAVSAFIQGKGSEAHVLGQKRGNKKEKSRGRGKKAHCR